MVHNAEPATRPCALDGCGVTIVRQGRGGRPRLYCSDAHRAEARRRRLGGGGPRRTPRPESDALSEVRRLLGEAVVRLDEVGETAPSSRDDALLAAVRAQSTAELLAAQQVAADATRRAAATEERLARERADWQARMREVEEHRAALEASLAELAGALEGAHAELEAEIVRHHRDVESLEAELHARSGAHQAVREELEGALESLRHELELERASGLSAARRIEALQAALDDDAAEVAALHMRAARAEERARQGAQELARARRDLERARSRAPRAAPGTARAVAQKRHPAAGGGAPPA